MGTFQEILRNMDNEIFLMACGIVALCVPFVSVLAALDVNSLKIWDYLYIFSGAAMGPTGLFAIANDSTRNMKINAVYLVYAAFKQYRMLSKVNSGEIIVGQISVVILMFSFIFYILNFICLLIYIKNYKGSFEERILNGEFDNDPLLKETIENDKILQSKLRAEEKARLERLEEKKRKKLEEKEKKLKEKEEKNQKKNE